MENCTHYLNTDLDLTSAEDLTPFASILEAAGFLPLHVMRLDEGQWRATLELNEQHDLPADTIEAMVDKLESLPEAWRAVWQRCTQREFNIGYDCGTEPWAFNQGLSSQLLGRMAALGASLRVTLYPYRETTTEQRPQT